VALAGGACWRIGKPTEGPALVTWAAYPETVRVGEVFSFEFAGPVAPTTCGRLDTAIVRVADTAIVLSARRSIYDTMCADGRVSFYEARPLQIQRAGRYSIRSLEGRSLGELVAVDSGRFSAMRAVGDGTLESAGGCRLFGPGWIGGQRPFALRGAARELLQAAGPDEIVHVEGRLVGFAQCRAFGSRPAIRVDTAWSVGASAADYYANP